MDTKKIVITDLNSKVDVPLYVEVDEAYQEFRDKLLELGFGMKCNGSKNKCRTVWHDGANDKIYLVELGKKAQMQDIVYIWDYADIDQFPDTGQQIAFFEEWMK